MTSKTTNKYALEVRERTVRMVRERTVRMVLTCTPDGYRSEVESYALMADG